MTSIHVIVNQIDIDTFLTGQRENDLVQNYMIVNHQKDFEDALVTSSINKDGTKTPTELTGRYKNTH